MDLLNTNYFIVGIVISFVLGSVIKISNAFILRSNYNSNSNHKLNKYSLKFFFILLLVTQINFVFASRERFWIEPEYLHWWVQASPLAVPLVTKNNNPASLAIINEPGTTVIFGQGSHHNEFNLGGGSGIRLTLGGWVDDSHSYGLEANAFRLIELKDSFSATSLGSNEVINIPFITTEAVSNPLISLAPFSEDVLVFKRPNTAYVTDTFNMWGMDFNALLNLQNQCCFPMVFLLGGRFINLNENLILNDAIYGIPTPQAIVNVQDDFSTRNRFYGLQFGVRSEFVKDSLFINLTGTLALGKNFQTIKINGETNENNTRIIQPIGLFAEPTNIGTFTKNQFTFVPELRIKLGYNLNQTIRPYIAYSCLYINNVVRPGNQIDRQINLTQNMSLGGSGQLLGRRAPIVPFRNESMWIQGGSVGLDITF